MFWLTQSITKLTSVSPIIHSTELLCKQSLHLCSPDLHRFLSHVWSLTPHESSFGGSLIQTQSSGLLQTRSCSCRLLHARLLPCWTISHERCHVRALSAVSQPVFFTHRCSFCCTHSEQSTHQHNCFEAVLTCAYIVCLLENVLTWIQFWYCVFSMLIAIWDPRWESMGFWRLFV